MGGIMSFVYVYHYHAMFVNGRKKLALMESPN
jgi:hypothetical protein